MIRRTRLKFFAVMAIIVVGIMSVFCTGIVLYTRSQNNDATNNALDQLISDFEKPPSFGSAFDRFNSMRGFAVKIDLTFKIIQLRLDGSYFSEDDIKNILKYIEAIITSGEESGSIDNIAFKIKSIQGGVIIAGLDLSLENAMFRELLATVFLGGGIGTTALLIVVWLLSFWIVKPAAASLEKQKRFISEASHELKTPLTIILTSVDLLQRETSTDEALALDGGVAASDAQEIMGELAAGGELAKIGFSKDYGSMKDTGLTEGEVSVGDCQKTQQSLAEGEVLIKSAELAADECGAKGGRRARWIQSIKEQAERMSQMTTELLSLSRIDERIGRSLSARERVQFDLSQLVLTECLAFESVAFENGRSLVAETENGLRYKGSPQIIAQAVRILCDNAIKHSIPSDTIRVSLYGKDSRIVFSVTNKANSIKKEEIPLLFERFYRGSESRANVQGTGLGLPILKNLASIHGFKIKTELADSTLTFSIIF